MGMKRTGMSASPRKHCGTLVARSSREKQCLDFRLNEVLVGSQRFGYSSLPDKHEGNAIGEAPIFVGALLEEPVGGFEQRALERDDFHIGIGAKPVDESGSGASMRSARQRGAKFKNDRVGRDSFMSTALQIGAEAFRNRVVLIARREQRDRVSRIEKNSGTHYA